MCFDCTHALFSKFSKIYPSFLPSQLCTLLRNNFKNIWAAQIFLDMWSSIGQWSTYQGIRPQRKLSEPLPEVTTANKSRAKGGVGCQTLLSMLEFCLSWACKGLMHNATGSVNSYVQLSCCVQKTQQRPLPLALRCFPPSVPQWSSGLEGAGVVYNLPSGMSTRQSLFPCTLASCGSLR